MPELAEVEWFRKQWNPGLGQEIVRIALHPRSRVFREANVRALHQSLVGEKLLKSESRGKRMLFEFSGDIWLGLHLGMTGKIHVEPPTFRPEKHDHLTLYQGRHTLVFTDYRQFGRVRFSQGRATPDWWQIDVPEIHSSAFDQKSVDRFLARHGRAPIKAVVLMQEGFSGIGNWMADEILWRARIHPAKRARNLTAQKRTALFRQTKWVVRESLRTLGNDYSDPPRGWLIHQKWKPDGVCPRHRQRLRHAIIGGRSTAWCPSCQK
jgi:formamidopyrimidine-DNA glycosylase